MILILAGTQDARELAISLQQLGFSITASVISKYGEFLYENPVSYTHLDVYKRQV